MDIENSKIEDNQQNFFTIQNRWRASLDALPDIVFFHDQEFRILRANKAYAERSGLSFEHIIGQPYFTIFPKSVNPNPTCVKGLERDGIVNEELELSLNEKYRVRMLSIHDEAGNYLYSVHIMQNITEIAKFEEKRKMMMSALEQTAEGVVLLDPDLSIRFANTSMGKLVGCESGSLLGKPIASLIHQDPFFHISHLDKNSHQEGNYHGEIALSCVSGEVIPCFLNATSMYDDHGHVTGYVGSFLDLRPLREREKALVASEARLNRIVSEIADGILVLNQESVIQFANPSAAGLFGHSMESLVGIPFGLPDHLQGIVELEIPRRDGYFIAVEMRLVGSEWGGEEAYVVSLHDISERRRLEEERIASALHLRNAMVATVNAIAATIEKRDPYTAGHQQRVAHLSQMIARKMGLEEAHVEAIYLCGVIHDIGKISTPAEILSSPRRLNDLEMGLIKMHPESGYEILKEVPFDFPVAETIRQHHERLDGSGYPRGLRGGDILLEARIISVADVIEAMASHRPYRPGLGIDAALAEIRTGRGSLYDAKVVDACLELFSEGYRLTSAQEGAL